MILLVSNYRVLFTAILLPAAVTCDAGSNWPVLHNSEAFAAVTLSYFDLKLKIKHLFGIVV